MNGSQPGQTFIVHYTDGTSAPLSLSLSDWGSPQSYSNQTIAVSGYRNTASGGRDNRSFDVYAYTLNIDNTKTVSSITLPMNYNVKLLAMTDSATAAGPYHRVALRRGERRSRNLAIHPFGGDSFSPRTAFPPGFSLIFTRFVGILG